MNKTLFAGALALVAPFMLLAPASAEPELKPYQEEAKAQFDEAMAEPMKAMNAACGTSITLKSEYEKFNKEDWKGRAHYSWCDDVPQTIKAMCEKRPAYKKVIPKKIKTIACLFTGVKPPEKNDGSSTATIRNMELKDGVFTFHMATTAANVGESARTVLEKALDE